MGGITDTEKVTDFVGSLVSAALIDTVPEEFPPIVTEVEALPAKSVVVVGVPRTAAFAGETVHVTPTPLKGCPVLLSTSTCSSVGSG